MDFLEYEFTCTKCGRSRKTLINKAKLDRLNSNRMNISDVFRDAYDISYKAIFSLHICSSCYKLHGNIYDVDINESTDSIESKIAEMYENDIFN